LISRNRFRYRKSRVPEFHRERVNRLVPPLCCLCMTAAYVMPDGFRND